MPIFAGYILYVILRIINMFNIKIKLILSRISLGGFL